MHWLHQGHEAWRHDQSHDHDHEAAQSHDRGHDHNHEHDHHDHGHDQAHGDRVNHRPLAISLVITTIFLVTEIIGGLLTNSLALLADAGHMATDAAALALALVAVWLARRPSSPARSYGFLRAEVLAALVNAAALVVICISIFWEAFRRLGAPPEVDSGPMLVVAFAGLIANAASAWVLMRGGDHEHNLNTRGAFLHVVGDMLGSVGAIVAAIVMLTTGWYLADPILSAGIGLLILWGAWRLLWESVDVLMESTPKGVDTTAVRSAMAAADGVSDVHDLHIWTVTSGVLAMSCHVEVAQDRDWHETLPHLSALLRKRFGISHITLQPEGPCPTPDPFRGCSLDTPPRSHACQLPAALLGPLPVHRGHHH